MSISVYTCKAASGTPQLFSCQTGAPKNYIFSLSYQVCCKFVPCLQDDHDRDHDVDDHEDDDDDDDHDANEDIDDNADDIYDELTVLNQIF